MCIRKASIYRSLGVSERYVAESDCNTCYNMIGGFLRLFLQDTWHHLIGWNILIFKVTHVSNWLDHLCHRLHAPMSLLTHADVWHVSLLTRIELLTSLLTCADVWLTFCMLFMFFISWNLANFCYFLNGDGIN